MHVNKFFLALILPLTVLGAARGLKEHIEGQEPKGFFVLNETENPFIVRVRIGGGLELEYEYRRLVSALRKERDESKKADLAQEVALCRQQLASLYPIRVVVPKGTTTQQNEFFPLPPHAFIVLKPEDLQDLRVRVWPQDAVLTQDVDEQGKPTMTSKANYKASLGGWAAAVDPDKKGLIVYYKDDGQLDIYPTTKSLYLIQQRIRSRSYTRIKMTVKDYKPVEPVAPPATRYTSLGDE